MGNIVNINNSKDLNSQAISWVVKLDGQRLSAEEFSLFRDWHDRSDAHAAAFKNAATTWGNLDILSEVPLLHPANETRPWWKNISINTLKPQLSFAIALILIITLSFSYVNMVPENRTPEIYTTAVGHHKTVSLVDGSTLLLNTGSQVEVLFSDQRRTVKLIKGEAHFDVAHDTTRPFEVHAGTNIVRAVGTAFTVELKPELVEVTVTEGKVQLATVTEKNNSGGKNNETPLAMVTSGQSAQIDHEIKTIMSIGKDEISRRLAWQNGALIFNGEPLDEVIQEVSRYTTAKIVISDPEIRHLKIGGYYKTNETDAMLQALETSFGISVKRVDPDLIYLSRAKGN